jgi:hypothetical protein
VDEGRVGLLRKRRQLGWVDPITLGQYPHTFSERGSAGTLARDPVHSDEAFVAQTHPAKESTSFTVNPPTQREMSVRGKCGGNRLSFVPKERMCCELELNLLRSAFDIRIGEAETLTVRSRAF